MNEEHDQYVKECPYCGGTEIIVAYQDGYGAIMSEKSVLGLSASALYHSVCRNCGSIVRSYAKEPEKLLKKKDRK